MRTLLLLLLLTAPALAQQQHPPTAEERIATTIGNLVMQNAQLQTALALAQARIKELESSQPKPPNN